MSNFNEDWPVWGFLTSMIGFIGDSLKVVLKWNREDDETMFDFIVSKVSALAVILVALAGLTGLFLYIYFRTQY